MALATLCIADAPAPDGQVWSDGWVVDPRDDVLYVLSLIGSPTSVRVLHAAIAERTNLRLTHQHTTRDLKPHAVSRYQTRSGRLPSGAVHAVLSCAPSGARLVLAESEAALPRACFEDLVLHRGLMAIPEWAPCIFDMLLDRNHAHRLAGLIPAALVSASEAMLDQLVQEALQQGAIAFPPESDQAPAA
ncbi:MAG: hypothetical protein ACREKH_00085 [Candidatus Rokuibacteriota bacterium]